MVMQVLVLVNVRGAEGCCLPGWLASHATRLALRGHRLQLDKWPRLRGRTMPVRAAVVVLAVLRRVLERFVPPPPASLLGLFGPRWPHVPARPLRGPRSARRTAGARQRMRAPGPRGRAPDSGLLRRSCQAALEIAAPGGIDQAPPCRRDRRQSGVFAAGLCGSGLLRRPACRARGAGADVRPRAADGHVGSARQSTLGGLGELLAHVHPVHVQPGNRRRS